MLAFLSAPWFLKIKVLRNQGIFQRLEKIQVLQTFQVSTLKKGWVYSIINLKTIQVPNLKIIQGSEDLKFFKGLKQALFSQNLDFQKSGFRLKGRVRTPRTQENASIPNQSACLVFLELCVWKLNIIYIILLIFFSHVII